MQRDCVLRDADDHTFHVARRSSSQDRLKELPRCDQFPVHPVDADDLRRDPASGAAQR